MDETESVDHFEANKPYLQKCEDSLNAVAPTTRHEYMAKLRQISRDIDLSAEEPAMLNYLSNIENPNTRSNKAFALIRLRRANNWPIDQLASYRDDMRAEIRMHRKTHAKANLDSLISYEELMQALDKLEGRKYIMNYLYAHHGLRNNDINARYAMRKSKGAIPFPDENLLLCNPTAKKPKALLRIVNYKTAKKYGPKEIVIENQRFIDELKKCNLKRGDYVFAMGNGQKPTLNYMNVRAVKDSINNYGEGRIAKILVKHFIDTKQFDKVGQLSAQRGTSLATLYTTYNVWDHNQQSR